MMECSPIWVKPRFLVLRTDNAAEQQPPGAYGTTLTVVCYLRYYQRLPSLHATQPMSSVRPHRGLFSTRRFNNGEVWITNMALQALTDVSQDYKASQPTKSQPTLLVTSFASTPEDRQGHQSDQPMTSTLTTARRMDESIRKKRKRRESSDRHYLSAIKFPRQCPFVLLLKES
jgi:hypothetical protein